MDTTEVTRRQPVFGSAASVVGRLGVRAQLVVIVAVSALGWGLLAQLSRSPWIFADELIYVDLARSIGDGGSPAVRGVVTFGYGLVYPALLAPVWALTADSTAYALARGADALVMSLAAVPAYLLARMFVTRRSAVLVAAFTVAVPSMAYTATLMTEVAFYPAFLLAVWLIARALDRPTAGSQLLAFAGIGLAAATKVLAVALLGAYVAAVLALAVLERRDTGGARAALRRYAATWVVLGLGLLAGAGAIAAGHSALGGFGAYETAVRDLDLGALPLSILRHLGALSLYTAVFPLAASALVAGLGLRRSVERSDRVFACLAATTVLGIVGGVAVFASYASNVDFQATGVPGASPLYERNVFVVVPLLLIGLALWIERRLPRPRPWAAVAACACLALVVLHPWSLLPRGSNPQNLAPTVWLLVPGPSWLIGLVAGAIGLVAVLLWLQIDATRVSRLWMVVGVWFALAGFLSIVSFTGASAEAARLGRGDPADWIDRAVPPGASVSVVWREKGAKAFAAPNERQRLVWVNEVFNESVGRVYALGPRMPFGLADTRVRARADGTLVDERGRAVDAQYVLVPCSLPLDAPLVRVDRGTAAALFRTDGPVRLARTPEPACPAAPAT